MKQQTVYHGNENKKVKPSKVEKVYAVTQKLKAKALALAAKKEATS